MIDAVEPLSLILWAIVAFSAGLYPLGFILGSCSTCCGGQCGDPPVEFNRCIRFVNTNTSAPQTTYAAGASVDMPLHGYSRAVTRPLQVGAVRVATKRDVSCGTRLSMYAAAMSDGETRSSTYRIYYYAPDYSSNMDLGTALQWNVTLQGVTRPLEMPSSIPSLTSTITSSGAYNSRSAVEYGVGDSQLSVSAATSVSVHSASVVSGWQWLDGAVVTESALKAMLAASIEQQNSQWVSRLVFTANVTAFQYVPYGSEVSLSYVIKHSRGTKHRYKTFAVTVLKGSPTAVTETPTGGIPPISISPQPYTDTPYGVTPPVFSGSSATIYSDNAVWNGTYESITISFPSVEISPTGPQLRSTELALDVTEGQYLRASFASSYGRLEGTPTAFAWIMRAFDPGVGATFNGFRHPAENQWNYDTEAVLAFLKGDATMPYSSGNNEDPTNIRLGPPPSTTWTMQVSDPTQFCGASLCNEYSASVIYQSTPSKTLTYTPTVKLPNTYSTSEAGAGTTTYTNLCYGQDTLQPMSLRLSGCSYSGTTKTCQSLYASHAGNYGAEQQLIKGSAVRYFYCGDLLWAIENGPCRQSLTYTGSEAEWYNCGTYALDGDDDSLWAGDWMCFDVNGKHRRTPKFPNGKCPPLELEVEVTNNITLGNGYYEFSDAWRHTGTVSPGTYVLLLDNESETSGFFNPYGNCNYQGYSLRLTSDSGWIPNAASAAWIHVRRGRDTWCSSWTVWRFDAIQGAGFVNIVTSYNPWRVSSSGMNEGYEPALGTDFDVTSYEEIDPVPTSVSPKNSQVPKAGGSVTLQRCCPQRTEVVTIPQYAGRFAREILLDATQDYTSPTVIQVTQGATAYVTQAGYDGVECPFDVIWLSGSTGYSDIYNDLASAFPSRIFSSESCPIVGQVSHAEQIGCDWTATTSASWLVAKKNTDTELLEVSIDKSVDAVFTGSLGAYFTAFRSATVTIFSGGTSNSWTIIQLKP